MDNGMACIFSINTGRCGSEYLRSLFDEVPGCRAFHERQPFGNGAAMRRFAQEDREPMRRIANQKAEMIQDVIGDGRIYVETNHCFIKGFGWFLPDLIPEEKIGVVILKRDPAKVVASLLRVGCTPLTPLGRDWITTPDKKNPLVPPPSWCWSPRMTWLLAYLLKSLFRLTRLLVRARLLRTAYSPNWLTEYERECLRWYVRETEAQTAQFRQQFPGIRYYEVDIDELNTPEQVLAMLACFGCPGSSSLNGIVGKPTNLKRSRI